LAVLAACHTPPPSIPAVTNNSASSNNGRLRRDQPLGRQLLHLLLPRLRPWHPRLLPALQHKPDVSYLEQAARRAETLNDAHPTRPAMLCQGRQGHNLPPLKCFL
jgi:hypothetical protein